MAHYQSHALTESCAAKLPSCTHVCVGISPFNGYFNQPRITSLVSWALDTYPTWHFFVPDEGPAYTFQALGYTPQKAAHKARRQGAYVINKISTALRGRGVENPADHILSAAVLKENARYVELCRQVRELFDTDIDFRRATMTTSEWVLAGYMPAGEVPTEEQKLLAVQYFLDELPMFLDTAGIVGIDDVTTFVYHQEVPFLMRLFDGELAIQAAPTQTFTVLEPLEDAVAEPAPAGEQDPGLVTAG